MSKLTDLSQTFDTGLLSHIEFCIDDQRETFNNIVKLEDYTPLYEKLHESVINELADRDISNMVPYDKEWCTIHDNIEWDEFIQCSNKIIK